MVKKAEGFMAENNDKYRHMRAVAYLTQFGLNIVSPLILCILFALWLKNTFNIGSWIMFVAILLGIAAGVMSIVNFIKTVNKETGGDKRDKKRED